MHNLERSLNVRIVTDKTADGAPYKKLCWNERNYPPPKVGKTGAWDMGSLFIFVVIAVFLSASPLWQPIPFVIAFLAWGWANDWRFWNKNPGGGEFETLRVNTEDAQKPKIFETITENRFANIQRDEQGDCLLVIYFPPYVAFSGIDNYAVFPRERIKSFILVENDPDQLTRAGRPRLDEIHIDHGEGETTLIASHLHHRADMRKLRATMQRHFINDDWRNFSPEPMEDRFKPLVVRESSPSPAIRAAAANPYQQFVPPQSKAAQKNDDVI